MAPKAHGPVILFQQSSKIYTVQKSVFFHGPVKFFYWRWVYFEVFSSAVVKAIANNIDAVIKKVVKDVLRSIQSDDLRATSSSNRRSRYKPNT